MKISPLSAIHIIFNLHVKKFPLDFWNQFLSAYISRQKFVNALLSKSPAPKSNPFDAYVSFLYPLKSFSGATKTKHWHEMCSWIKSLLHWIWSFFSNLFDHVIMAPSAHNQAIFIRLFFSHFVLRLKSNKIQIQRFMSLSNDSKMLWRSLWGMQFDLE